MTLARRLKLPVLRYFIGRPMVDPALFTAIVLTSLFGLAVLFSAADGAWSVVTKQSVRLAIGFAALLIIARIPPQLMRTWTPTLYLGSVALLVLVAVLGEGRGAQRWLDLGVVRFQPSELLKLTLPMMLAWYFHQRSLPPRLWDLLVSFALIGVPGLLIAIQPDLGTALLVAVSGLFVLFLAGIRWRIIASLAVLAAASSPLLWYFMHPYQRNRVLTLINPESDPLGQGWNIIQSKIAVGSGGLYGKGWQNGTQAHLDFLPERSTDFILAAYAEEFGLIGVIALLLIYLYLIGRSLTIATLAKDAYCRLLAGSISLTFCVYVLVNSGMISGLLPVVGIPLPLVSYGGTSVISLLAGFGIIMSVFSHRKSLRGS